jgi:hypothetical protein
MAPAVDMEGNLHMLGKVLAHCGIMGRFRKGGVGEAYHDKGQKPGCEAAIMILSQESAKETGNVKAFDGYFADYRFSSLAYKLSKLGARCLAENIPRQRRHRLPKEDFPLGIAFLELFKKGLCSIELH